MGAKAAFRNSGNDNIAAAAIAIRYLSGYA
jgi:hypothetical protein